MSALNPPIAQAQIRQPIAKALFAGQIVAGWAEIAVDLCAHYEADSFRVTYPLYALPAANNPEWWSSQSDLDVEIDFGFNDSNGNPGQFTNMLYGIVDDIQMHWDEGLLEITGRDYSGALIDSIVTQNYQQQTSSEIATAIIANHPQLTPQITATTTPVGKYYNQVGSRLSRNESEWDFLTALAQFEGFVAEIRGKTFYFGPPSTPDISNPYLFNWVPPTDGQMIQGNVKKLSTHRSTSLARDIKVVIQSMNRATGQAIKETYTASNTKRGRLSNGNKIAAQVYTYNIPNLTQGQAQQEAQARALAISRHERVIEATTFGDVLLTKETVIQLTGTATDFDQLYYVDKLTHRMSADEGYDMECRAKNHSTYSTVPL